RFKALSLLIAITSAEHAFAHAITARTIAFTVTPKAFRIAIAGTFACTTTYRASTFAVAVLALNFVMRFQRFIVTNQDSVPAIINPKNRHGASPYMLEAGEIGSRHTRAVPQTQQ